jgi:hypothetical protein
MDEVDFQALYLCGKVTPFGNLLLCVRPGVFVLPEVLQLVDPLQGRAYDGRVSTTATVD